MVSAKLCTWVELETRRPDGDPWVDLARICDMHEQLIIEMVNDQRAQKAASKKAKKGRKKRDH